jgi:hypothetical protein
MVTPTEMHMRLPMIARGDVHDDLSTNFSNWVSRATLAGTRSPGSDLSTRPRPHSGSSFA